MITLTYGTTSITLRNPDFGNRETLDIRRISRKTRGGDLVVYRDPDWPKIDTVIYKFSYLFPDDQTRLRSFMKLTLGVDVTMLDYEGRTWTGVITDVTGDFSQEERENYVVGFKFEGSIA